MFLGTDPRPSSAQGAAFLVSSTDQQQSASQSASGPDSGGFEGTRLERAPTSLSLELGDDHVNRRKLGRGQGQGSGGEHKVCILHEFYDTS